MADLYIIQAVMCSGYANGLTVIMCVDGWVHPCISGAHTRKDYRLEHQYELPHLCADSREGGVQSFAI